MSSLRRQLWLSFAVISLILPGIWLTAILTSAPNYLPFGDQWYTPMRHIIHLIEGQFSLGELFTQHNESRKFVPSILTLIGFKLMGYWSLKLEMIFGSFLTVIKSVLIAGLVYFSLSFEPRSNISVSPLVNDSEHCPTTPASSSNMSTEEFHRSASVSNVLQFLKIALLTGLKPSRSLQLRLPFAVLTFSLMVLLNFGRSTYIFQFWSVTIERILVDCCVVATLFTLLPIAGRQWRVLLLIFATFISAYSYSSGLALIPLSLLIAVYLYWQQIFRWQQVFSLTIANSLITFSYFWKYWHNPGHSSIRDALNQSPGLILKFLLAFLGNVNPFVERVKAVEAITSGSIFVGLGLILFAILVIRFHDRLAIGRLTPIALVAWAYSSALAVMAWLARLPMGFDNAIREDYIIHANFAILGIWLLLLQLLWDFTNVLPSRVFKNFLNKGLYICGLSLCGFITFTSTLTHADIKADKIAIFHNIRLIEDCVIAQENLEASQCFAANSPFYPDFKNQFLLAQKHNLFGLVSEH